MANVNLAPDWGQHFHDDNGNPATGWRVYIFESSTEDYKASYSDSEGTVLSPSPFVELNTRGEYPGEGLFLIVGEAYTLELRDALDVVRKTVNNIIVGEGSGDAVISLPAHTLLGNNSAGQADGFPVTIESTLDGANDNNIPDVKAINETLEDFLPNSGGNTYTGNLDIDGALTENGQPIDKQDVKVSSGGTAGFLEDKIVGVGDVSVSNVGDVLEISVDNVVNDNKVKVSNDDTTPNYLAQKLNATGANSVFVVNDGANEILTIEGTGQVIATATDETVAPLIDKLVAGDGIAIEEVTGVAGQALEISVSDVQLLNDIVSGIILEPQTITVTKDGPNWYVEVEAEAGGDLSIIIAGVEYILDCTTGAGTGGKARSTTPLVLGTATVPNIQYIAVNLNVTTPEIVIGSSINRSNPFAMCGVVELLDDAYTTTDGSLYYQRFNDSSNHDPEGRGMISEIAERVRIFGPRVFRGVEGSTLITTNAGLDSLELSTTAGIIYQLHQQTVSAKTPPNEYVVVNDSITPYKTITDLNEITLDANGGALHVNGRFYGLDFGITVSSEGQGARFYVWLPSGSYQNSTDATNDLFDYANVSLPIESQSSMVRLCRMVIGFTNPGGGTLTNALGGVSTQDRRNHPVGTTGAGGLAGSDFTKYPFIPQTASPVPFSEGTTFYHDTKKALIVQGDNALEQTVATREDVIADGSIPMYDDTTRNLVESKISQDPNGQIKIDHDVDVASVQVGNAIDVAKVLISSGVNGSSIILNGLNNDADANSISINQAGKNIIILNGDTEGTVNLNSDFVQFQYPDAIGGNKSADMFVGLSEASVTLDGGNNTNITTRANPLSAIHTVETNDGTTGADATIWTDTGSARHNLSVVDQSDPVKKGIYQIRATTEQILTEKEARLTGDDAVELAELVLMGVSKTYSHNTRVTVARAIVGAYIASEQDIELTDTHFLRNITAGNDDDFGDASHGKVAEHIDDTVTEYKLTRTSQDTEVLTKLGEDGSCHIALNDGVDETVKVDATGQSLFMKGIYSVALDHVLANNGITNFIDFSGWEPGAYRVALVYDDAIDMEFADIIVAVGALGVYHYKVVDVIQYGYKFIIDPDPSDGTIPIEATTTGNSTVKLTALKVG